MRVAVKIAWRLPVCDKIGQAALTSTSMDGRMERDPTMDARIVHSVSVSNKKEQSTFLHKERSLRSARDVQEHIHRREEKELIRQLTKLQDEKGRRHPDTGSRTSSRTYSRLSPGPDANLSQILQLDRHSGDRLSGRKSVSFNPKLSGGHLSSQSSNHRDSKTEIQHDSSNEKSSATHLVGGPSNQKSSGTHLASRPSNHKDSFGHRRQSVVMRSGMGLDHPSGHRLSHYDHIRASRHGIQHQNHQPHVPIHHGLGGTSSKHTNIGISPQMSHLSHDSNQGPPLVHQPAGYGHTIKEYVEREGLNKKRPSHSYMAPKGSTSRASGGTLAGDEHMRDSLTTIRPIDSTGHVHMNSVATLQALQSGNDLLPGYSSHHKTGSEHHSSQHRQSGSKHGMAIPSRYMISRLFGGQSMVGIAETNKQEQHKARQVTSDESLSSADSKEEKVLKVSDVDDAEMQQKKSDPDNKINFQEKSKGEKETSMIRPKDMVGRSDHVVIMGKGHSGESEQRKRTNRITSKAEGTGQKKPSPPKGKKSQSKSFHGVRLSHEIRPGHSRESKAGSSIEDYDTSKPGRGIQIPLETLYDLRSSLGGSLQLDSTSSVDEILACLGGTQPLGMGTSCAYDPSSSSKHNRLYRARLRALQTVNAQLEALRKKQAHDPMKSFDPLEVLKCRYLRLSKSNIASLLEMCHEAGVDVDLHPHMDINDVSKIVFDKSEKTSKTPSSSSVDVKHVIV